MPDASASLRAPLAGVSHGKRFGLEGRRGALPRAPHSPRGRGAGRNTTSTHCTGSVSQLRPRQGFAVPRSSPVRCSPLPEGLRSACGLRARPGPDRSRQQPRRPGGHQGQAAPRRRPAARRMLSAGLRSAHRLRPTVSPTGPAPTGLMPCPPDRAPRHAPRAPTTVLPRLQERLAGGGWPGAAARQPAAHRPGSESKRNTPSFKSTNTMHKNCSYGIVNTW